MKYPDVSATWRLDSGASGQGWVIAPGVRTPLSNRAFARAVAERHYWTKADLILSLEKAFFLPDANLIPRDRKRYLVAIAALLKYMQANEFPATVMMEFVEFAQGLAELDESRVRECFKPTNKKRGRNRDAGDVWQARALASIALNVMTEDGRMLKDHALDLISKHFGFLGDAMLSTTSGTFRGALAKWHQDFSARDGCESRAQETFDCRDGLVEATRKSVKSNDPNVIACDILRLASHEAARASSPAAIDRFKKRHSRIRRPSI